MTSRRPSPLGAAMNAILLLIFIGGMQGCKEQPTKSPPPASPKPKTKRKTPPMPWTKKPPTTQPAAIDESWIKDLTAISAPEAVRRYLMLSTKGDLTKVKPFVAKHCYKTRVGAVTSTLALGSRLSDVTISTALVEEKDDAAIVSYEVVGLLKKRKKAMETNIFGVRVEVRPAGNDVSNIKRHGKLHLKRIAGKWQLVCPKIKKVKEGLVGVKVRKNFHKPHLPGLSPHRHKGPSQHKGKRDHRHDLHSPK